MENCPLEKYIEWLVHLVVSPLFALTAYDPDIKKQMAITFMTKQETMLGYVEIIAFIVSLTECSSMTGPYQSLFVV